MSKQPTLKPQDLLVALKLAIHPNESYSYNALGGELMLSASEVHAAVKRAELSKLVSKIDEQIIPNNSSLKEFVLHGLRYIFPAIKGSLSRGIPTSVAGPILEKHFTNDDLPLVWPDANGSAWGIALTPIYQSVPHASQLDKKLYELLTLLDALRAGAARERELASQLIEEFLP